MTEEELKKLDQEKKEVDALLDNGVQFTVKDRTFTLHRPPAGVNMQLCSIFIDMVIDEDAIQEEGMIAVNKTVCKSAPLWAKAVATAVLSGKRPRRFNLLSGFLYRRKLKRLTNFFLWNMTSKDIKKITELLLTISDFQNFLISTRLIAGARMTKPNPVEQSKQA